MKPGVQAHGAADRKPLYIVAAGAGDSVVVDRRDWNREELETEDQPEGYLTNPLGEVIRT